MARYNDQGAYEIGNVKIITNQQNHRERKMTRAARNKISKASRKYWAALRQFGYAGGPGMGLAVARKKARKMGLC